MTPDGGGGGGGTLAPIIVPSLDSAASNLWRFTLTCAIPMPHMCVYICQYICVWGGVRARTRACGCASLSLCRQRARGHAGVPYWFDRLVVGWDERRSLDGPRSTRPLQRNSRCTRRRRRRRRGWSGTSSRGSRRNNLCRQHRGQQR